MARSQTFHDTDGVDQEWEVSFTGGYLSREHVSAYFYPTGLLTDPRQPVAFTWVTDSLIRITPALPAGGKLLIQRVTPLDQSVVRFTDIAQLTKQDMQTAADQAVLAVAELVDQYEDPDLLSALADARAAAETATLAGTAAAGSAASAATSATTAVSQAASASTSATSALAGKVAAEAARDVAVTAKNAAEAAAANNAKTNTANTFTQVQTFSAKPVIPQAGAQTDAPLRQDEAVPLVRSAVEATATQYLSVAANAADRTSVTLLTAVAGAQSTTRQEFDYAVDKGNTTGSIRLVITPSTGSLTRLEHSIIFTTAGGLTQTAVSSIFGNTVEIDLASSLAGTHTGSVSVRYGAYTDTVDSLSSTLRVTVVVDVLLPDGQRRATRVQITGAGGASYTVSFNNAASTAQMKLGVRRKVF